ncbi:Biotin/lipoyl attachment domain protein [Rhodopirellula maiorica SM1]|uniref:Dihydrolipoyllysine-residue acetyltransferase component of pyruvate dehydrogenase complex n=1 Tax=Rhodopirellula maiorica SM1 TaxID=1265738 RepID=M5RH71_9BACT|nr:Biotin/lipoyl attachment domain protein [Rhodopirellula maiorica SM1]
MATEVKLPELGDGIESGDVLEIFVSVGDVISKGQDIVEMETDKATVPVPASVGGKVTKILVSEGDSVAIGGVILEVEAAAEAAAPEAPAAAPKPETKPETKPEPKPEPKAETPAPEPAAPEAPAAPAPASPAPPKPQAPAPAPPAPAQPAAAPVATTTAPGEVIPAGPAIRRFAREVGVDLASVQGLGRIRPNHSRRCAGRRANGQPSGAKQWR